MGIPLYFRYIAKNYPHIILDIIKKTGAVAIDETVLERLDKVKNLHHLYLDMNCLIHPACRSVLTNSDNMKCSKSEIEAKMFKSVRKYLEHIILFAKPSELLYISIDGPAPRAKMNQQRLRRYRSVMERAQIKRNKERCKIADETYDWDTNAITPGTKFMNQLNKMLHNSFNQSNIIISDSTEPGEGEHKILQYMKQHKQSLHKKHNCIYGLDADLIMLSLVSNIDNIYLLRERTSFNIEQIDSEFLYLNINSLKNILVC